MGECFQSLVAPDIAAGRAKAAADRMLAWLVAEEIVLAETRDCVLAPDPGHPPGRQYMKAIGEADTHLLGLRSNGLEVIVKRNVFFGGPGKLELICSACDSRFEAPDRWAEAVGEWSKQIGPGQLACPVCGQSRSVADWRHDPPWGFGELGFTFWNWPQFTRRFIKTFQTKLGSRIVLVCGKL